MNEKKRKKKVIGIADMDWIGTTNINKTSIRTKIQEHFKEIITKQGSEKWKILDHKDIWKEKGIAN